MLDMTRKDILPAMSRYSQELAEAALSKGQLSADMDCVYERETVKKISAMITAMHKQVKKLETDLLEAKEIEEIGELGNYYKDKILSDMTALRISADEMETIAAADRWPYPSYGELLFGVR